MYNLFHTLRYMIRHTVMYKKCELALGYVFNAVIDLTSSRVVLPLHDNQQ